MKRFLELSLSLVLAGLGAGCATTAKAVESLDLAQCEADEGILVTRFVTSRADEDDLQHPEVDPDIDYAVAFGTTKSMLLGGFAFESTFDVEAKHGPALIVRKLKAGDYYFNEIHVGGGQAPLAVKFTVQPGRVTYIGDLLILFIEDKGFLGMKDLSCAIEVGTDPPGVMSLLAQRYAAVPSVDTVPMVVEKPSL